MSCKVDNKIFHCRPLQTSTYVNLCEHPNIDIERELSFVNLIVVRNHDAKISFSYDTCCGVSVLLCSFALFVFKVKFGPNDCNFAKAVCVNPWNHSNANKSLTHSCKFFFKPCKICDHSWAISDNPFGCVLPLVHSTLQAASNPQGGRVKNPFLGKSLVYIFL